MAGGSCPDVPHNVIVDHKLCARVLCDVLEATVMWRYVIIVKKADLIFCSHSEARCSSMAETTNAACVARAVIITSYIARSIPLRSATASRRKYITSCSSVPPHLGKRPSPLLGCAKAKPSKALTDLPRGPGSLQPRASTAPPRLLIVVPARHRAHHHSIAMLPHHLPFERVTFLMRKINIFPREARYLKSAYVIARRPRTASTICA